MILRMKRAKTVSTAGRDHLNAARPALSGQTSAECGHCRREGQTLRDSQFEADLADLPRSRKCGNLDCNNVQRGVKVTIFVAGKGL